MAMTTGRYVKRTVATDRMRAAADRMRADASLPRERLRVQVFGSRGPERRCASAASWFDRPEVVEDRSWSPVTHRELTRPADRKRLEFGDADDSQLPLRKQGIDGFKSHSSRRDHLIFDQSNENHPVFRRPGDEFFKSRKSEMDRMLYDNWTENHFPKFGAHFSESIRSERDHQALNGSERDHHVLDTRNAQHHAFETEHDNRPTYDGTDMSRSGFDDSKKNHLVFHISREDRLVLNKSKTDRQLLNELTENRLEFRKRTRNRRRHLTTDFRDIDFSRAWNWSSPPGMETDSKRAEIAPTSSTSPFSSTLTPSFLDYKRERLDLEGTGVESIPDDNPKREVFGDSCHGNEACLPAVPSDARASSTGRDSVYPVVTSSTESGPRDGCRDSGADARFSSSARLASECNGRWTSEKESGKCGPSFRQKDMEERSGQMTQITEDENWFELPNCRRNEMERRVNETLTLHEGGHLGNCSSRAVTGSSQEVVHSGSCSAHVEKRRKYLSLSDDPTKWREGESSNSSESRQIVLCEPDSQTTPDRPTSGLKTLSNGAPLKRPLSQLSDAQRSSLSTPKSAQIFVDLNEPSLLLNPPPEFCDVASSSASKLEEDRFVPRRSPPLPPKQQTKRPEPSLAGNYVSRTCKLADFATDVIPTEMTYANETPVCKEPSNAPADTLSAVDTFHGNYLDQVSRNNAIINSTTPDSHNNVTSRVNDVTASPLRGGAANGNVRVLGVEQQKSRTSSPDGATNSKSGVTDGGRFTTSPVVSWTVDDVSDWLESIGMGERRDRFVLESVDGATLKQLNRSKLISLGMANVRERMNFERALMRANDRCPGL